MSISPEFRISRIPRFAMVGAALFSLASHGDLKPHPNKGSSPEMTIQADSPAVGYTVQLSEQLVQNYFISVNPEETPFILVSLNPAQIAAKQVTPLMYKQWSLVNICEESGNWHPAGEDYSGLGISAKNWIKYGGEQFAPTGNVATPDEQIVVARRIEVNPPDQNGCSPDGW